MTQTTTDQVKLLDVRPMLAAGEEPLDAILGTARQIAPGAVLELVAPFEPMPLYAVLGRLGFVHRTEARADGACVVRFTQTGITAAATVAEVAARYPEANEVFARYGVDLCCGGGKTLEFVSQAHHIELKRLLNELQEAASKI